MKANELRIGNLITDEWYSDFKNIIVVDSINSKGIDLFIQDDGNWAEIAQTWIEAEMPFDSLRGIPLTEELLLSFGFNPDSILKELYHISEYYINDFRIVCNHHPFHVENCGINIEYVHELQNLYFALTGEELVRR